MITYTLAEEAKVYVVPHEFLFHCSNLGELSASFSKAVRSGNELPEAL